MKVRKMYLIPVWGRYVIFLIIVGSGFQIFLFKKKSTMGPGLWKLEISNNRSGLGFLNVSEQWV
jgi:hypothetical protein